MLGGRISQRALWLVSELKSEVPREFKRTWRQTPLGRTHKYFRDRGTVRVTQFAHRDFYSLEDRPRLGGREALMREKHLRDVVELASALLQREQQLNLGHAANVNRSRQCDIVLVHAMRQGVGSRAILAALSDVGYWPQVVLM